MNVVMLVLVLLLAGAVRAALPPDRGPSVPDACHVKPCNCQKFSQLFCSCNRLHQVLELKDKGHGYLPVTLTTITVEGCAEVIVFSRSIKHLNSLRQVNLRNLEKLTLEEDAFSWDSSQIQDMYTEPGINIQIENSTIVVVPTNTFAGRIDTIILDRTRIGSVRPFAFSRLAGMQRFHIKDSTIQNIESQGFKKYTVDLFIVEGGTINNFASYAIKDVTVREELRFEAVTLGRMRSLAVSIEGPTAFRIKGCSATLMEGDSWQVNTAGPVFIHDNTLVNLQGSPFMSVTLDSRVLSRTGRQELIFENNTIGGFDQMALTFNTTGLQPKLDRLVLDHQCSCQEVSTWSTRLVKYTNEKNQNPDVSKLLWCMSGSNDVLLTEFRDNRCDFGRYTLYWIIGSAIGAVLLAAIGFCCCCFLTKWRKMYKQVKANRQMINENRLSTYSTTSAHIMVMPASKSYLETELDIFQEAEPLKSTENVAATEIKVAGL